MLLIFISVGAEMVDLIGKAMNFTSDIGSNFFLFQFMDVLEQLYASGNIYNMWVSCILLFGVTLDT